MNDIRINLTQAASYMIQMFYMTGMRYSCTRTKIGKLLTVASFLYASQDQRLFLESIYKYDNCGTIIPDLKLIIDRDVYQQDYYDDNKQYIDEKFDTTISIPARYEEIDMLPESVKKCLEDVFRRFGAYSAGDLGEILLPIVNYEGIADDADERIHVEKLSMLNRTMFEGSDINIELIEYLYR